MDNIQLETILSTDTVAIDPVSLTEIDTENTDAKRPDALEIEDPKGSIENAKNPYSFFCGDIPVNIRFASDKKTLERSLSDYFISLK